jgi:hypothetical protein
MGSRWCGGLDGLANGAAVWENGSNAVAVSLLRSPPVRGGGSREGGNGEREWWGLRCRLRLHARACACDVEATAGREHHAAPFALHGRHDSVAVCPTEWSPTWWSDSECLTLINS